MALLILFTACSASPFDCGEYAEDSLWFIPALVAHFLIALFVRENWGPLSVVRRRGGP